MTSIRDNWDRVQVKVAAAAKKSGRDPDEISIVAVSKTFPVEAIQQAVGAGVNDIGENRVQEAWQKYQVLGKVATWHLVGHLQTNKVKRALEIFDVVHSVDSFHLAEEIDHRSQRLNRKTEVFLEVKTSDEPTKLGVEPGEAGELAVKISGLKNIHLNGLMTIGEWSTDEQRVRRCFKTLASLKEEINRDLPDPVKLRHLSMGMSGDFEWAIEEGATVVRIGTAIFGNRNR